MSYLCPNRNSLPLEDTSGKSLGERSTQIGGARFVKKNTTGSNETLSVVQTGESVNQAKVFRAHAVPQGFCGNLIHALKLLANQQRWRWPHTEHRDEPR